MRGIEMVGLGAQDRSIGRFRPVEFATAMGGNGVEKLLLGSAHDSQRAGNLRRSKESTMAPQQLSVCECHKLEKNFEAILKPRLTRGFSRHG
jgi:hypothetical protein